MSCRALSVSCLVQCVVSCRVQSVLAKPFKGRCLPWRFDSLFISLQARQIAFHSRRTRMGQKSRFKARQVGPTRPRAQGGRVRPMPCHALLASSPTDAPSRPEAPCRVAAILPTSAQQCLRPFRAICSVPCCPMVPCLAFCGLDPARCCCCCCCCCCCGCCWSAAGARLQPIDGKRWRAMESDGKRWKAMESSQAMESSRPWRALPHTIGARCPTLTDAAGLHPNAEARCREALLASAARFRRAIQPRLCCPIHCLLPHSILPSCRDNESVVGC